MIRYPALVFCCLWLWCFSAPAMGGTAEKEKARAKFKQGLAEAQNERYPEAAALFEAALAMYPTKSTLYNLALAYKLDNRFVEALQTFERLDSEYAAALETAVKEDVVRQMAELAEKVATLRIDAAQPDAIIRVDGAVRARREDGTLLLDPGVYDLEVSAAGYLSKARRIAVASGAVRTERFDLTPRTTAPPAPAPLAGAAGGEAAGQAGAPAADRGDRGSAPGLTIAAWSGAGLSVAAGATAGILFAVADRSYDTFRKIDREVKEGLIPKTDVDALSRRGEAFDDWNTQKKLALGFAVAAGALVVTTAALFVVTYAGKGKKETSLVVTPMGVGGRF